MTAFLETLKSETILTDGAMGSYLFEQTGRLSEMNHVYESLNVSRPDLIEAVHRSYLQAGARCLKTNSFGANTSKLELYGLGNQVRDINEAAIARAHAAVQSFRDAQSAAPSVFVLASIGPTLEPVTDAEEVAAAYHEQLVTLIAGKPDAILLETFSSLPQLEQLVAFIQSFPDAPPIIAEMTVNSSGEGSDCELSPVAFVQRMIELAVPVAGINCCAPWDATAFLDALADVPEREKIELAVMPNAGGFQRIGNRFMSSVNPEFMGQFARTLRDRGVRLVGGCCEVYPAHIQEMRNYLQSRQTTTTFSALGVVPDGSLEPASATEKAGNGRFSKKLFAGEFVVSVEMLPPRGTSAKAIANKIATVKRLWDSDRVDAVDITDGSRGIPLMPPGDFVSLIREALGWKADHADALELIPHFTSRDLNVMGIQSRLIGYFANRIHNVLFVTGDPPKMSPSYPRSTAVFDLNSVDLIRLCHNCLNRGVDFGAVPLGKHDDPRTHFTIGTGFEPEALDLEAEMAKLDRKIDGGADYVMTQPAFRHEPLAILDGVRDRIPIVVGVMILTSLDHARRMQNVPGVVIPESVMARFEQYESVADQAKVGRDVAIEQLHWIQKNGWAGLYLMSPSSSKSLVEVLIQGL